MKHQTRLSLVKIAFICFSFCNVVVPTPLKKLSRLRRPLSRLRRPKKELSPFLQTAKQAETNCNKKDWLTDLDKLIYSKVDLINKANDLLFLISSGLTVAVLYNFFKLALQMRQNHDNSGIS